MCSNHILEIMFNEPQLLLVFRVALEIEMIYGSDNDPEEPNQAFEDGPFTGDNNMTMDGVVPSSPDNHINFDATEEGKQRFQVYQYTIKKWK